MGASFSMSFRIWKIRIGMFSVAKKSFEEYLFGFTFVLLYFRWGISAEIISGFAKTGVVFSDTSFIGASFSVTSFICPPFMGSSLRVSFQVGSSCRGHPASPTSPLSKCGRCSSRVLSIHCFGQSHGRVRFSYVCSSFRHRWYLVDNWMCFEDPQFQYQFYSQNIRCPYVRYILKSVVCPLWYFR